LKNKSSGNKGLAPREAWFSREKKRTEFSKSKAHFSFFGESHEKNKRNNVLPFLVELQAFNNYLVEFQAKWPKSPKPENY